MFYSRYIVSVNSLIKNLRKITLLLWNNFVFKASFLPTYYSRSENIWNDGFLFDFLQKKTADAWVRRFVIYTGFLLSERLLFDYLVRIYLDNLIWPMHNTSIFETSNVSEMLLNTLFIYLTTFTVLISLYILVL